MNFTKGLLANGLKIHNPQSTIHNPQSTIHNPQSSIINHQSFSSLPLDLPPSPLLFSQQYSKLAL
jgi:hypothetical protein